MSDSEHPPSPVGSLESWACEVFLSIFLILNKLLVTSLFAIVTGENLWLGVEFRARPRVVLLPIRNGLTTLPFPLPEDSPLPFRVVKDLARPAPQVRPELRHTVPCSSSPRISFPHGARQGRRSQPDVMGRTQADRHGPGSLAKWGFIINWQKPYCRTSNRSLLIA